MYCTFLLLFYTRHHMTVAAFLKSVFFNDVAATILFVSCAVIMCLINENTNRWHAVLLCLVYLNIAAGRPVLIAVWIRRLAFSL